MDQCALGLPVPATTGPRRTLCRRDVHPKRETRIVHPTGIGPPARIVHPTGIGPPARIVHPTGIDLPARIVHPTGIGPSAMEIAQLALFHRIALLARIVHPTGIGPRDLHLGSDPAGK